MKATCPECSCLIELHKEQQTTGVGLVCPECETELEVATLHPPRLVYTPTGEPGEQTGYDAD